MPTENTFGTHILDIRNSQIVNCKDIFRKNEHNPQNYFLEHTTSRPSTSVVNKLKIEFVMICRQRTLQNPKYVAVLIFENLAKTTEF